MPFGSDLIPRPGVEIVLSKEASRLSGAATKHLEGQRNLFDEPSSEDEEYSLRFPQTTQQRRSARPQFPNPATEASRSLSEDENALVEVLYSPLLLFS